MASAAILAKAILPLTKTAFSGFLADNGMRMAASLAYFTIFSLAPLLIITIAIAGWVFGDSAASNAITGEIQGFVGYDAAKTIQSMIQSAHKPTQGIIASFLGTTTLLFGATGVFAEVRDSLNSVWTVESRIQNGVWSFVKSRFLSVGMVLAVGFLLLVSLMVSALMAGAFKYFGAMIPVPELLLHAAEFIVSLSALTGLFAMMFAILPETQIGWNDVGFGAFATAGLFTAGKTAIGLYVGKTISASAYGAAGSLLLVVAWIYYSALISYFGAEFTRAYATSFGSKVPRVGEPVALRPRVKAAAAGS
jgi:membrane protein